MPKSMIITLIVLLIAGVIGMCLPPANPKPAPIVVEDQRSNPFYDPAVQKQLIPSMAPITPTSRTYCSTTDGFTRCETYGN